VLPLVALPLVALPLVALPLVVILHRVSVRFAAVAYHPTTTRSGEIV
jgi:hypothetical protein